MKQPIKFLPRSIFLKLVLIIITMAIIVILLVAAFFGMQFNPIIKTVLHKNINHYFSYLVQEIGNPPDTTRANKIANEYSIHITYYSKQFSWSTPKSIVHTKKFRRPHWIKRQRRQWTTHQSFTVLNEDGSKFIFGLNYEKFMEKHEENVMLLILIIGLIFMLSYLFIRKILQPIKLLSQGVEQVSAGNLKHHIPVEGKDELGQLSKSFNEMTKRIRDMINSRDQLLLDVSHELRSPITRMKIALEFIADDKRKASIVADLSEMETMITEILETERLKDGHGWLRLENHNLVKIIKEVTNEFRERTPGLTLINLPQTLLLKIDLERIKIVLKNVLENALKYSTTARKPVEICLKQEETTVRVQIKDFGSGIPEEHIPHVFEPFYRVDKSRSRETGGYGLGLSLCKKIMEAHGGKIDIANHEEGGTIVNLWFVLSKR